MGHTVKINIAKEFSRIPAGRLRTDGPYSGERFREECLEPVLMKGDTVEVIFDGARGYGSSFLEEAFGGLVRDGVLISTADLKRVTLVSKEDPSIAAEVRTYIENQISRSYG